MKKVRPPRRVTSPSKLSSEEKTQMPSARLAVRGVLAAARAELCEFHAIGVVATILLGDVVTLLALGAGKRDLRANIAGLLGHDSYFRGVESCQMVQMRGAQLNTR